MNQGLKFRLKILLLLFVVTLTGALYFIIVPKYVVVPSTAISDNKNILKTYRNGLYGFQVLYPATWNLQEDTRVSSPINVIIVHPTQYIFVRIMSLDDSKNITPAQWLEKFSIASSPDFRPYWNTKYLSVVTDKNTVDGRAVISRTTMFGLEPPNFTGTTGVPGYETRSTWDPAEEVDKELVFPCKNTICVISASSPPSFVNQIGKVLSTLKFTK